MNIIFIGDILPRNIFEKVSFVAPSTNNLELAIIKRLYNIYGDKLHILSKNFKLRALEYEKVTILSKKYIIEEKIEINTIKFYNHKLLMNITGMYYLYKSIKNIKKRLIHENPNEEILFIIFNPYYQQALPVYMAKNSKDIVLSIISEGLDIRYLREKKITLYDNISHLINKWLFKKNKKIVTYCANTVKRYAPNIKYLELLHSCDISLFDGIEKKNLHDGKITIVYAGMLVNCYGINVIINTMKRLPENYNLILCGGGSDQIIKFIKEAEIIDKRIRYLGLISREEVIKLEVSADILLLIRVADSPVNDYIAQYCQSSKISEYLMSGTPVIATKIPSIPAIFDDYLNYTTSNSDEIAKEIISVANNDNNFYSDKANRGKKFAKSNCTYEKQFSKLIDFIQ